jgi:hypothetical protein
MVYWASGRLGEIGQFSTRKVSREYVFIERKSWCTKKLDVFVDIVVCDDGCLDFTTAIVQLLAHYFVVISSMWTRFDVCNAADAWFITMKLHENTEALFST